MVSRGRHPKKAIADALDKLNDDQFDVHEIHRGHRWGEVVCNGCGEKRGIWSTPRDQDRHASDIDRFARRHADCKTTEETEEPKE
jgi:hypothetical protein